MVRKVTIQNINELQLRFKLQEVEPVQSPWLLSETIIPVTNVDSLIGIGKTRRFSMAGWTPPIEVPAYFLFPGEIWVVHSISWNRLSGDATFNKIGLRLGNPSSQTGWIYQFPTAASGAWYLPHPLTLHEGDGITMYADGGVAMSSVEWVFNVEVFSTTPNLI